jgi:hypothetical protein
MSAINPNETMRKRGALALLLATVCAADAQAGAAPHGPPGPPAPPGPSPTPSAEELATVPSLSSEQQVQLHRILVERRDAHETIAKRSRALLEAQRDKDRAEHERIDEQTSERARKLLGDEGFRHYAEWARGHRGADRADSPHPPGPRNPDGPDGDRSGRLLQPDDSAAPLPPPDAADHRG